MVVEEESLLGGFDVWVVAGEILFISIGRRSYASFRYSYQLILGFDGWLGRYGFERRGMDVGTWKGV